MMKGLPHVTVNMNSQGNPTNKPKALGISSQILSCTASDHDYSYILKSLAVKDNSVYYNSIARTHIWDAALRNDYSVSSSPHKEPLSDEDDAVFMYALTNTRKSIQSSLFFMGIILR